MAEAVAEHVVGRPRLGRAFVPSDKGPLHVQKAAEFLSHFYA